MIYRQYRYATEPNLVMASTAAFLLSYVGNRVVSALLSIIGVGRKTKVGESGEYAECEPLMGDWDVFTNLPAMQCPETTPGKGFRIILGVQDYHEPLKVEK